MSQTSSSSTNHRRWRALPWAALALLSLAVAAVAVGPYATSSLQALSAGDNPLATNYAHQPGWIRAALYAHIAMAGLALVIGPVQFLAPLRRRLPQLHRMIGLGYVIAVAIGAIAGFVIAFINHAGLVGLVGFGALAILWAWTTYRGLRAALAGDLPSHRAWMIRSFALTFAAVTLRLELGLLIGGQVAAGATDARAVFDNAYHLVPFLCWLPNLVVAELMVRRRNLPGLRYVSGAAARTSRQLGLDPS